MRRLMDMGRAMLEAARAGKTPEPVRFESLTEEELVGAFGVAWDTALLRGVVHMLRAQRDKATAGLVVGMTSGMSNDEMRGLCGKLAGAIETEAELIKLVEAAQRRREKAVG